MKPRTGVFCDKTKDVAGSMSYTAFVCPADEKKYCCLGSNGNQYDCIPETISEEWGRSQSLTSTKVNCTGTCRYQPLQNISIQSGLGSLKITFKELPYSEKNHFSKMNLNLLL